MSDHAPAGEPPMNLETLRALFEDDTAAIREILEAYLDDLEKNGAELRAAAAARDRRAVGRVAHSMKGASGNVGAARFADRCATLERRGVDGPWEELDAQIRDVGADIAVLAVYVKDQINRLQ